MQGNQIESYAIVILNIMYFIHVFLMKLNYAYEVQLKKSFASFLEIRELNRLASLNISHFHLVLDTRHPSIEVLNKIDFKQEGDILIFPNGALNKGTGNTGQFMAKLSDQIKYRMKAIQRVKIREERRIRKVYRRSTQIIILFIVKCNFDMVAKCVYLD